MQVLTPIALLAIPRFETNTVAALANCGAESLRGRACLLTLAMLAHHHWRLRRTIIILRVCEFSLAVEFLQQLYWQFATVKLLSQSESTRVLAILSHVERSSALTQPLYTTK